MWEEAKKFPHINAVEELGEDEFMECLSYVSDYFATHKKQRDNDGIVENMGPQSYPDKESRPYALRWLIPPSLSVLRTVRLPGLFETPHRSHHHFARSHGATIHGCIGQHEQSDEKL